MVGFFVISLEKVQGERPHEADVSAERFPYSQVVIKCAMYHEVKEKLVSLYLESLLVLQSEAQILTLPLLVCDPGQTP